MVKVRECTNRGRITGKNCMVFNRVEGGKEDANDVQGAMLTIAELA